MKYYMIITMTFVIGFLSLLVTTASAQVTGEPIGRISLGPQIGYFQSKDADNGKLMLGAALRAKVADVLGIEGSIDYRQEEYSSGAATVTSWPVMVTALIYPVPVIYGAIGAGWYNSSVDYKYPLGINVSGETKQEFGWHFGGGLELPVGSSAELVGDVRYVFLNYNFQNFPGSNGTTNNFYVIDVSVLFNL